jgi:hypothetical protein
MKLSFDPFACYDVEKRQIRNTIKGSFTWHHEDRHRQQHDKDFFSILFLHLYYISIPIVFLMLFYHWEYAILFYLIAFVYLNVPEVDAFVYQIKKYIEAKKWKKL